MTRQQLVLIPAPPGTIPAGAMETHVWACPECRAMLEGKVIAHKADCGFIAEIAAAERQECIRLSTETGAVYFAEPQLCDCKPECPHIVRPRIPFADRLGGES